MAEEVGSEKSSKPGKGKGGLVLGLLLAVMLGAGGFFLGASGLVAWPVKASDPRAEDQPPKARSDTKLAFVEIEPVLIALARESERRHLRFRGHLEVDAAFERDVTDLMPRILDVLNSYLRAVEIRQLEDPAGLIRLRAQMLRRVQIVTGEGRVKDLLISEFVLN